MHRGFIKIHRKITDNPVYMNPNCFLIFTELLLRAVYKDQWVIIADKEVFLKRGQATCGLSELAKARGLTMQQTRTALKKMKNWGVITSRSTNAYTVVTICKYECYNSTSAVFNKQDSKQITNDQQTGHRQITTYKNDKKVKHGQERGEKGFSSRVSFSETAIPDFKSAILPYAEKYSEMQMLRWIVVEQSAMNWFDHNMAYGWKLVRWQNSLAKWLREDNDKRRLKINNDGIPMPSLG